MLVFNARPLLEPGMVVQEARLCLSCHQHPGKQVALQEQVWGQTAKARVQHAATHHWPGHQHL